MELVEDIIVVGKVSLYLAMNEGCMPRQTGLILMGFRITYVPLGSW